MAIAQANIRQVVDIIVDGKQRTAIGVKIGPLKRLPLDSFFHGVKPKSRKRSILIFPTQSLDPGEGFWLREPDYKTINKVSDELRTLNFRIKLSETKEIVVSRNEQAEKSEFDMLVEELKTELDKCHIKYSC